MDIKAFRKNMSRVELHIRLNFSSIDKSSAEIATSAPGILAFVIGMLLCKPNVSLNLV